VIVRPRQAGKTYEMVQWVKQGEPTRSYPFWSRIILCPTLEMAQRLRTDETYGLDYTQVFGVDEWRRARKGPLPVEVAIDNLDLFLAIGLGQTPAVVTVTGDPE
jgi:hypothetical protein